MKKLVVLGAGESGVGAAILGKEKAYDVWVSDKGEIQDKYKNVLLNNHIKWEENNHTESKILTADVVVKSPGIPDHVPLIQALINQGTPVWSEIEFAAQYSKAKLIAITGSNGKTTTTMLTHFMVEKGLGEAGLAGNIGYSFAEQVAYSNHQNYVLEISSFQLDGIQDFRPHIAVLLNITPDHLDRYDNDFEKYIASKFRIAENQTASDYLIFDADDTVIANWLKKHPVKSQLIPFSLEKELEKGVYVKNNNIIINLNNEHWKMRTDTLTIQGKHNLKNGMAATAAAQLIGIRKQTIRESMELFNGVEHRLEHVLKIQHVKYINDSKATNVNATYYALDSMTRPTVWIVGGVDKGNDYLPLMPMVREKVKAIICLGVDNTKLMETFQNVVDVIVETQDMGEAVKIAYHIAERNDTVLLSPACASFDLFENYEDRGRQFKQAIKQL